MFLTPSPRQVLKHKNFPMSALKNVYWDPVVTLILLSQNQSFSRITLFGMGADLCCDIFRESRPRSGSRVTDRRRGGLTQCP